MYNSLNEMNIGQMQNADCNLAQSPKQHSLFCGGHSTEYGLSSGFPAPMDPNSFTRHQAGGPGRMPQVDMYDKVHNSMDFAVSGEPADGEYPGASSNISGIQVGEPKNYGYLAKAHKQHPFGDKKIS